MATSNDAVRRQVVLLAEDDEDLREILSDVLEAEGFETVLAGTGPEALDRARVGPLDLAVVDLNLPGASGRDVVRALHERRPGLPVVLMTGESGLKAPEGTTLLSKPIRIETLFEVVRAATGRPCGTR